MNIELNTYLKGILLIILVFSAWRDLKEQRIPNEYIIRGICIRILLLISEVAQFGSAAIRNFLIRIGISLIILGIGLVLKKVTKEGIGMGDIKLLMLMYLYLETGVWIGAVFYGLLCGFVHAVYVRIRDKGVKRIPFAPALLVGTVISLILSL